MLRHKPDVTRTKIDMRYGIISPYSNFMRLMFYGPPKIRYKTAAITNHL
jgi:hypothetical protein